MIRTPPLAFAISKEIRGLRGAWLACLAVLLLAEATRGAVRAIELPVYIVGAAAIGALSMGQEYTHRTLTLLLAQPVRRQRHLLAKLSALAVVLLTLAAATGAVWDRRPDMSMRLALAVLPLLCGLFVAPWLTMVCRSAIAGTVFTLALPGLLLTISGLVYFLMHGQGPSMDVELTVMWRGTLALCAVAAVMGWRTFMRLESIDGRGPAVTLPRWLRRSEEDATAAPPLTKGYPMWLLVKKEIWLQQIALAVAAVCLGLLALVLLWPIPSSARVPNLGDVLAAVTVWYSALVSMLIGAIASAEERHLGTLDSQLLLPIAARKQWAVKAGTAVSLALLLALGLPGLLLAALNSGLDPTLLLGREPWFAAGIATLTILSLYVSSFCTDGLRALLISVPAIFGSALPAILLLRFLETFGLSGKIALQRASRNEWQRFGVSLAARGWIMGSLELLLVAAVLALALRFAFTNHRSAAPLDGRVWAQVLVMVVVLAIGAVLLTGMMLLS